MNNTQNLLSQLKDIHQPQPVSWWPPAPGWFLLTLLILIVSFLLGMIIYKLWRRYYRKYFALKSLNRLNLQYQQNHETSIIAKTSTLLKRVMIAKYGKQQIACLTDIEWLIFLDYISNTNDYTQGVGKSLLTAPYQAKMEPKPELFTLIEKTFKRCL